MKGPSKDPALPEERAYKDDSNNTCHPTSQFQVFFSWIRMNPDKTTEERTRNETNYKGFGVSLEPSKPACSHGQAKTVAG